MHQESNALQKPQKVYAEDATSTTYAAPDSNNPANESCEIENEDYIPQSVYDNLPILLKDACSLFNDRHEKDIFLLGTLSVFGGCFHNLYAFNDVDKKKVAANLLTFIVAPPASGKGALKYAKKMITAIKDSFTAKSKVLGSKESGKLLIPANNSSAGLIQLLQKNKGVGIIIESEIDTLVNANKQDWGNYSDILRNAFENESALLYRKTDKEYIEIEAIKLALAISGTPNQFKNLMFSAENGLFSRGSYYVFESTSPNLACYGRMNNSSGIDLDTQFADFANVANGYYNQHLGLDKIHVVFNENQLVQIQTALQTEYNRVTNFPEIRANINRSFTIALKTATILTFLKECETGKLNDSINCTETALQTAIQLMQTFLNHSYKAYDLLPKKSKTVFIINQERLYIELPIEFNRAEAITKGAQLGIGKRTVDGYLKVYKDKDLIEASGHGKYRKIE